MSQVSGLQESTRRVGAEPSGLRGPHFPVPDTPSEFAPIRTRRRIVDHAYAIAGVSLLGLAWHGPGSLVGAGMGWVATGLILQTLRSSRPTWPLYVGGLVGHAIAFEWVYETVAVAGRLGPVLGALIFAGFVATAAFQFAAIGLIHRRLGPVFDALALRGATAVVLAELLVPRLFLWHLGHTQLGVTPLAQAAGLGGALLITFVMVWTVEALLQLAHRRRFRPALVLPFLGLGLALAYGAWTVRHYDGLSGPTARVILVQGNATLAERRDLDSAMENAGVLFGLTGRTDHRGALVIWPEGSIPAFVPTAPARVEDRPALPWLGEGTSLLVGAYAADAEGRRYNAAFAIDRDGRVDAPYFKRVLIPFGESLPFADIFPAIARLNPRANGFTPGDGPRVFRYPWPGLPGGLNIAPLICYEDTLPALAAESTRAGAEVLVNLTSDAWFGRSIASRQHHAIAAFRAIENRRYLIRATNTGYSAVVDPVGRTVAAIPPFEPGTALAEVRSLRDPSFYGTYSGDTPWWCLLGLALGGMGLRAARRQSAANA